MADAAPRKPNGKALSVFGSIVWSLMIEHGYRQQQELVYLLEEQGLKVSQPAVSKWFYGEAAAPYSFPTAFANALNLDEPEKSKLARAFAYGQKKPINDP